jgi:hypothetical protein
MVSELSFRGTRNLWSLEKSNIHLAIESSHREVTDTRSGEHGRVRGREKFMRTLNKRDEESYVILVGLYAAIGDHEWFQLRHGGWQSSVRFPSINSHTLARRIRYVSTNAKPHRIIECSPCTDDCNHSTLDGVIKRYRKAAEAARIS